MKSSSQVIGCQTIAKQALESVVSLGTRLYGYKIKHANSNLKYTPLFITVNSKGYNVDDNIKDAGDGSQLNFPPQMYQQLYKNLIGMDINPPIKASPQSNTGQLIISDKNTHPIEISTSVLIVNSVNALQYLYNADVAYSTGDGKEINPNNGLVSSLFQKYKQQFDLDDIEFHVKIVPVRDNTVITTRPILTRPRFPENSNEIPTDLQISGEEGVGFEISVKLAYKQNGQDFTCDGSHRFIHQMTGESGDPGVLDVHLAGLQSGAGKDFLSDTNLLNTSCDTHSSGYKDITVTLDFNAMTKSRQFGTVILCQMNSYCRSEGDDSHYGSCAPEEGLWQRCHNIQPKPSSDQSWTLKSKLKSTQELELQFDDMKENRRYDLNAAEFAIDGEMLRTQKVVVFYIDARRPFVNHREFTDSNVGTPIDDTKGRHYEGPFTYWKKPADSSSHGKWLQCNTEPVGFRITMDDQFTHNLKNCNITWKRRDGNGTTSPAPITSTLDAPNGTCKGTLSTIQHGRHTVTFEPKDTCEPGPWDTGDLVWDTDLPSSFKAQDFTSNPEWLFSADKDAYAIDTVVPAKNTAGKFPKHYSVDCDDNFQGTATRQDGNSGILKCELSGSVPAHDDGCNLRDMGVKYYHVCGGTNASCDDNKKKKWGVYAPLGESCVNVWCEPSLSCCDASGGTCNGVSDKQCGDPQTRHCTNPKGGTQSSSDEVPSGCPPLGLNDCSYQLPCEATSPCSETGPTSVCDGKRQGESCSYTRPRTCEPNDTSWGSSCNNPPGTWRSGCASGTCTAGCTSRCKRPSTHDCTCTRCTAWADTDGDGNLDCTANEDYTCDCHGCHEYEYAAVSRNMGDLGFSGTCGQWSSGGCSKKGQGGGNLTQEQCDQRNPICTPCPSGDSYPSNLNCPPCPPGDSYPSNPNCPVSRCVEVNGKACCTPADGGTCTGAFCIPSGSDACNDWGRCHFKDPGDGICRPSCGHLANMGTRIEYRHHGIDCKIYSGDEPRGYQEGLTCAELNAINYLGSANWKPSPRLHGLGGWEEIEKGGKCCVRDLNLPMSPTEIRAMCNDYWRCIRRVIDQGIDRTLPRPQYLRILDQNCAQHLP